MEKNENALALAFRRTKAKKLKIKALESAYKVVFSTLTMDQLADVVEGIATAKALATDTSVSDHTKGQEWYINSLSKFAQLKTEDQLQYEYDQAFSDTASEAEMLLNLNAM